jgi:hypothetical protein
VPKDAKVVGKRGNNRRIGKPNDVGEAELSTLTITTKGGTAGAMLVEWNIGGKRPTMFGKRFRTSYRY